MTTRNEGPQGLKAIWMAWNRPGGGNPRTGSGRGRMFPNLPNMGGSPQRWVGLLLGVWLVASCVVLVSEQQRGVVLRFGQFDRILAPGPSLKLPWPIERVIKVNATQIKNYEDRVPVLTRDENIVEVSINVQYRVANPTLYLFGTRNPDEVLRQAVLSTVREQVGRSDLDTVLGAREQLAVSARERLQKSLAYYRTGLTVTELNLPDARPPQQVKPAFDDVNSAQQDKQRLISEARAYAAKVVPEARGQAARVRTVAQGYKEAAVARATGDAQRFALLLEQYKTAPEVVRKRLWLETVQEVLANNRKVIGGDGRQLIYVPMPAASGEASAAPAMTPERLVPAMQPAEASETVRPARSDRPAGREEVVR